MSNGINTAAYIKKINDCLLGTSGSGLQS
jgi:hypothetical protein